MASAIKSPRVVIVYYSMYGHIAQLAEAEKRGIEAAGGSADIYQLVFLAAIYCPISSNKSILYPPKTIY
jgi:NAD(P)H dehydrogenase (quinone)